MRLYEAGTYDLIPQNTNAVTFLTDTLTLPLLERGAIVDTTIFYTGEWVEDYSVTVSSGNRSRPGFDYNLTVEATNKTTFDSQFGVDVTLDLPENYIVASISDGGIQTDNQIVWQTSIVPFGVQKYKVEGAFDVVANLGDQAFFFATINALSETDINFDNNFDELETEIVGSYDPNDKTTLATITPSFVENGEYLEYLVRFQNTGTDTAFNVLVIDTLTSDLQWDSFELLTTSHTAEVSRDESILNFHFANILLVDSTTNEPESHGYIRFKIKPEATLAEGDSIEGLANIYFDYNLPIETNKMVTQVELTVSVMDELNESSFSLYPNPTSEYLIIKSNTKDVKWELRNIQGMLLDRGVDLRVNMSSYTNGIYIININGNSYKIIKE